MQTEAFVHNDPDSYHDRELTLHDCFAYRISYEDGALCFPIPDGFWITPHHAANSLGKTVKTDAAQVIFRIDDIDEVNVKVYTRSAFRKTTVQFWDAKDLIKAVNSNDCTLEFIYQYRTFFEQMWHCALHSRKKPYYREIHLHLPQTDAVFRWNKLLPDREW